MSATKKCLLQDGPYEGDVAHVDLPLPEHVRVWYCGPCDDTHWANEGQEWSRDAVRYTLMDSSKTPAVYVHDGEEVPGDGEVPERETPEIERELVPAGPGEAFIDGQKIGDIVSIEYELEVP